MGVGKGDRLKGHHYGVATVGHRNPTLQGPERVGKELSERGS